MLTATLDRTTPYAPGETITLTVTSDKRLSSGTTTLVVALETAKVTTTIQLPVNITDDTTRKWALKSDDGKVAVYTSTA